MFQRRIPVMNIRFLSFNLSKASATTVLKTSSCNENVSSETMDVLLRFILIIEVAIWYKSSWIYLNVLESDSSSISNKSLIASFNVTV